MGELMPATPLASLGVPAQESRIIPFRVDQRYVNLGDVYQSSVVFSDGGLATPLVFSLKSADGQHYPLAFAVPSDDEMQISFTPRSAGLHYLIVHNTDPGQAVNVSGLALQFPQPSIQLHLLAEWGRTFERQHGGSYGTSLYAGYYLAVTEVSQLDFLLVMGYNPSFFNKGAASLQHPVENVTWYEAVEFCNRLSLLENRVPVYKLEGEVDPDKWPRPQGGDYDPLWDTISADFVQDLESWEQGYRLPTEAEWMWAAYGSDPREAFAGAAFADGLTYLDDYVWHYSNSGAASQPVRTRAPKLKEGFSFYDLSGNVEEWCWDIHLPGSPEAFAIGFRHDYRGYTVAPSNPPQYQMNRIVRGGSWYTMYVPDFKIEHVVGPVAWTRPGSNRNYRGFRLAHGLKVYAP